MVTIAANAALDRMLEPVTDILTPEIAQRIADLRSDPELQDRVDELALKSNRGELSETERREYASYVEAIDLIGILQAKARAAVRRRPVA